jgi:small subunit ribosomal protein S21
VKHLQVFARDNNIDQALRVLKKKMQREGVFREMKQRRLYEKPSERAMREKAESVHRRHKLARKQAIRGGLIAASPKKRIVRSTGPAAAPIVSPIHASRASCGDRCVSTSSSQMRSAICGRLPGMSSDRCLRLSTLAYEADLV